MWQSFEIVEADEMKSLVFGRQKVRILRYVAFVPAVRVKVPSCWRKQWRVMLSLLNVISLATYFKKFCYMETGQKCPMYLKVPVNRHKECSFGFVSDSKFRESADVLGSHAATSSAVCKPHEV